MKRKLLKIYPLPVVLLVCGFLGWVYQRDAQQPPPASPSLFQRFEWYLHDWRVQRAYRTPTPSAATNLAVVVINDASTKWMREKFPPVGGRWPFHHFHYGPMLDELKAQGARAVAFDIFFLEPDDRMTYRLPHLTGTTNAVPTTGFFADRMRASGNVILATAPELPGGPLTPPLQQLRTNAQALGGVSGQSDRDGIIRRIVAFHDDPALGRVWCLGFVLAAQALGADLSKAVVERDRIRLSCADGVTREVPLGPGNTFYLDWVVRPDQPIAAQRVLQIDFGKAFTDAWNRGMGARTNDWGIRDRLVVVGASGTGMNSVDRAPSALNKADSIFLAHVNAANSLLTGRFVQRPPAGQELAIIFGLAIAATLAGWRMPTLWASLTILLVASAYVALAVWAYVAHRYLLPMALPVMGALLTTHLVMTIGRGVENADRRHLEQLLKKVVSSKIIDVLLQQDTPTPQTRRMEITVLFADLRGFTRFSEESQTRAEAAARALGLPPDQTRASADEAAREAMNSVNRYLAAVVDEIKATDGTLDKYMGDCVMAFWGAPVEDANHAAQALKCAIAAEQGMERIYREFGAENQRRDQENQRREALNQPPLPMLPVLRLGIGLNSGLATVGFMGSENHLSSYTAFGHTVNVASRVEGLAGGGQIIATDQTVLAAGRNHPAMLGHCEERVPVMLKGIATPVKTFDVLWKQTTEAPAPSAKA